MCSGQAKPTNESEEWANRAFTLFQNQTGQADSDSDDSEGGDGDLVHPANDTFFMVSKARCNGPFFIVNNTPG